MPAEIQQSGRMCKDCGPGSTQTGAILHRIRHSLWWLRLGSPSISTRAFYPLLSIDHTLLKGDGSQHIKIQNTVT